MFDNDTQVDTTQEQQPESPEAQDTALDEGETAQAQTSSKDENFKALREKNEKLQKDLGEYARAFQELYNQQQQSAAPQNQEPEVEPSDEDLIDGKHYKKLVKSYRELEKRVYETSVESQVRMQYPDYDTVVNQDTIKQLRESEPELAQSLHLNPDTRAKAVGAYKAIKNLGLVKSTEFDADKQLAARNAAKPRTVTSISPQQGESPLSRANAFANGLTPELKKQLWKEIEDARKRS